MTDVRLFRAVSLDDDSVLGYSGADLLSALDRVEAGALTWHDGATTRLSVQVTGTTARVDTAPPYQGYCVPSLVLDQARVRIRSDDGRIDLEADARVAGIGDGALDVALVGASVELTDAATLQIPSSWSSPQRTFESLGISFHVAGASSRSPSCLPDEPVSTDPDLACNVYDGRLRFHAVDPDAPVEGRPPGSDFSATLGWWSW